MKENIIQEGNTCHSTIKMKPVDVKTNTNIKCSKEINVKNPKFEISDIARKHKNILQKITLQIGLKKFF